jgi:hypothetical protein
MVESNEHSRKVLGCDDLLQRILSYVDALSKVSTIPLVAVSWNRACQHPASWRSFNNEDSDNRLMIPKLLGRLRLLEMLKCNVRLEESEMIQLLDACPKLTSIQLFGMTPAVMQHISLRFPLLSAIVLTNTNTYRERDVYKLIGSLSRLHTLHMALGWNEMFTFDGSHIAKLRLRCYKGILNASIVKGLIDMDSNLEEFGCSSGDNVSADRVCDLFWRHGPTLLRITLPPMRWQKIGLAIAYGCPRLEYLYIKGRLCQPYSLLDDAAIHRIFADVKPALTSVTLRHYGNVSNEALSFVRRKCPRLVTLHADV